MAKNSREGNLNQGLPEDSGLDETTRANLRRLADGGNNGIKVGSFRDLQVGLTDTPVEDRPVNPNQTEENLVSVAENDAALGVETQATQDAGLTVEGSSDFDSMTKEELQAEAENRGLATSGTKDEIKARLGA